MRAASHGPRNRSLFWTGVAVGWAGIAFGVRGLLQNADETHPFEWSVWFLSAAVAHDFVLAPIVFAIGATLQRTLGARKRSFLQAALLITGLVVAASLLFAGRLGGRHGNPSALPNPYMTGLTIVLAAIWGSTGLLLVRAWRRPRASPNDVTS